MSKKKQEAFMKLVAAYIWWQVLASSDKERERRRVVDLCYDFNVLLKMPDSE